MLDGDVAVAELIPQSFGPIQGGIDAAAKKDGFGRGPEARQALQVGFHRGLKAVGVHTTAAQNPSGQTVLFQQRQQHMLGFQVLVPAALGEVLGFDDRGPGFFGELLCRGLHRVAPSSVQTVWASRQRWGRQTGRPF